MPRPADDSMPDVEQETYHSSAYSAAGAAMMSFTPINQIHQQLCGIHIYAHDPSRAVKAHHFCTHLRKNLHQCIIYDSDKPDARLIGIEYLIPEKEFEGLPEDEKKYWHSHKYEVESGMLMLGTKSVVPSESALPLLSKHMTELPAMLELHRTYGKTTHTWQYDLNSDLPLGPPQLMMAYTAADQVNKSLLQQRDEEMGVSTDAKRALRSGYLRMDDLDRSPASGCDPWLDGKKGNFEWVEHE
ncbi:MAG: hypothetical protein TREMPRED_005920 [Tremellales sp. Tagirdzhanova-0007]|nr:MAG: hypothetical protein TREMPRED_005920 [Tremellales sp. Tagirdzhanova-0007]